MYSAGEALVDEQKGAVELLDIDAAILDGLEGARVLHQSPCGLLRIGVGAIGSQFHEQRLIVSNAS